MAAVEVGWRHFHVFYIVAPYWRSSETQASLVQPLEGYEEALVVVHGLNTFLPHREHLDNVMECYGGGVRKVKKYSLVVPLILELPFCP